MCPVIPGRPELAKMYDWIRPEILVPVHGEVRHMKEQVRFGLEQGIPKAVFQQNGDIVRLAPKGPKVLSQVRTGRLVVDGDVILPADGQTLNQRRKIAYNGTISIAVGLDEKGKIFGSPVLKLQGVPLEDDEDEFLDEVCDTISRKYKKPVGDIAKVHGRYPADRAPRGNRMDGEEAGCFRLGGGGLNLSCN